MLKQTMQQNDVRVLKKEVLLDGFCHIERYTMQHKKFSGAWTEVYTRDFMIKPPVAAALPYDPVLDKVILIEQIRVGALGLANPPWLIEVVAGIIDPTIDTSLEDLVYREMREETCLEVQKLTPICDYFVTPGCSTEKVKLFCAIVDATKAPEYGGMANEQEDIRIHVVSAHEAFAAVHAGQIKNALGIIALQWLELNHQQITKPLQ